MAKKQQTEQVREPAPLTPATIRRVRLLFRPEDRAEACRLLLVECGNNLTFLEQATSSELDRFRYAALRLSGGNLTNLRRAISVAQVDWRDLLMAAGFGDDIHIHRRWLPGREEPRLLDEPRLLKE